MQQRPPSLLGAAAVQAADALIVVAGSVLAGVDTITGKSYQTGSGIALTLIGLATAAALAWVALGLAGARRWSRTPAALTQLFVGIVGIYLVQGHQYAWGIPSLVLACAGLALVLAPASLRALARPPARQRPGTPAAVPGQASSGEGWASQAPARPPRPQGRPRRPSRSQRANAPPAASSPARGGAPQACPRRASDQPGTRSSRSAHRSGQVGGSGGSGPRAGRAPGVAPGQSSPRPSARPGAGPGSWPAAGTRASARSPARSRSATASCSRRTAAAGCAFPGWAAAPAMA